MRAFVQVQNVFSKSTKGLASNHGVKVIKTVEKSVFLLNVFKPYQRGLPMF